MIEIKNVSKSFVSTNTVHAVKNVSLKIETNEVFGIVGYSGAGKSTLIRLINQLERVDEGNIIVDGVDVTKLNEKLMRKERLKMGMIFQNFNLLWSRTVKENIAYPLEIMKYPKDKIEQRCAELLEMVSLVDKKDEYPSALSGGQKQRVGIARALALNPTVLLCDEATSALDPKTTDDILDLLKKINDESKITIVIITHQMEVVQKICHKVAVMANGEVIEMGSTNEIFKNPKHELTRKLINSVEVDQDEDAIDNLKKRFDSGYLLRLVFDSDCAAEPILANIASNTSIKFNIVAASIKALRDTSIGVMYVHVNEEPKEFIELLKNYNVEVKIV